MSGGWTEREERIAAALAAQEGVGVSFRLRWKARDLIRSGALDQSADAALARVARLHYKVDVGLFSTTEDCAECSESWPCATSRAIEGSGEQ